MMRRYLVRASLFGTLLLYLAAGCGSTPPPKPAPVAEKPVPAGPLCEAQGPPIGSMADEGGWSFCVQQQADCQLSNVAEAVRLRWCEQSSMQKCVDTGCKKYRDGECRFGVATPPGVELTAVPPRNDLCGTRWQCKVRTQQYNPFTCTGICTDPKSPLTAAPKNLVTLAEGEYAVIALWADSLCPKGRMHLSAYDGRVFTLKVTGKCLPADLTLRAVFAPAGGAFFGVGEAPAEMDLFHLTGVVQDPDAFTAVLTRTNGTDEKVIERVRLTGRKMTSSK